MVAGLTDVPAFGGSGHPCAGMSLGLKVLVLCVAMSACEAEESGGGQRGAVSESDQGGPLRAGAVESDARKEPRRYRLSDQPLLQIGSAAGDGEVAFHGITGAVRLPSGQIVVANSGAWELKFFDPHGGFLAATGRYGDGPGDFRSLSRIGALREDRVAAVDRLVGRVSVFSSDGVLERTYNVSQVLGGVGRGTEWYGFLASSCPFYRRKRNSFKPLSWDPGGFSGCLERVGRCEALLAGPCWAMGATSPSGSLVSVSKRGRWVVPPVTSASVATGYGPAPPGCGQRSPTRRRPGSDRAPSSGTGEARSTV